MGKVQEALSEEMTEIRGALDQEKLERKEDNEARKRENEALERKIESRIVSERKKMEEELNSIKFHIRSMKTRSGDVESGTFAKPPAFTRWQSEWSPRKIELKEWVTDWSRKHIQGVLER